MIIMIIPVVIFWVNIIITAIIIIIFVITVTTTIAIASNSTSTSTIIAANDTFYVNVFWVLLLLVPCYEYDDCDKDFRLSSHRYQSPSATRSDMKDAFTRFCWPTGPSERKLQDVLP